MSAIFVPGQGMVSLEGTQVDRAVNEYDERLFFARNATTGQFTIFMKNIHGEAPLPIFAFEDMPLPEEAVLRLRKADAVRTGSQILDKIRADNERRNARFNAAASEAAGELAEAHESYLRNQGDLRYSTSFRPDGSRTAVKRG